MKTRLWVWWNTSNPEIIQKIRERFDIHQYITVNGHSPAEIDDTDMPLFVETSNRGYISIVNETWCKNGELYSSATKK